MGVWSEWRRFPDPVAEGYLAAPFGPGVYELRNARTGEMVLFGRGRRCAARMGSLLPDGGGTRNNDAKRSYVLAHLVDVEYRTRAFQTEDDAKAFERGLRAKGGHLFGT